MKSYNFDSLKFATEGLTGFGCTVIQDNANLPSFMIPINKRTNAQLYEGGSQKTHSAFVVDDVEYKRFFMSKFLNCIINGRAYSWPVSEKYALCRNRHRADGHGVEEENDAGSSAYQITD